MKTTTVFLTFAVWLGALGVAVRAEGAPRLRFDQTLYDFGKTSRVTTVSGVFRFTNVGDGVLKLEPPKPSCGCTVAELKPNTLAPGASGELAFSLHLGLVRAIMEKHITVRSNDPLAPEVSLSIKVDYTPLYELNPMTLTPDLAFGVDDAIQFTSVTRTDGKPLHIARLAPSQPWLAPTVEPGAKPDADTARIRIAIRRDGPPRRFNEYIHVYAVEETNAPVATLFLSGHVMGEVSVAPEALYWSINDAAAERTDALVLRRVVVRSANDRAFELKNPRSTIKGIKLELVSKDAGKAYEVIARLDEVPTNTIGGSVSFETSVPAQSRIEVPVIVSVFKP